MKYLFVLNNAFYLRNYGAVLRALAADGHEIRVAFSLARPGDADLFARVLSATPEVALTDAPHRTGWWWAAADPIRALRDYLHYQQPAFQGADRLIERASARVPRSFRAAVGDRSPKGRRRRFFDALLDACERAMPADPGVMDWLHAEQPDAVLFSPLLDLGYDQVHILKAARAAGLPTGHLVASWDNLLTKGRIQIAADRCIVWNAFQRDEATTLHRVDPDRIVVTGAQPYDDWYAWQPSRDRAAFCAELGLEPERPIVLYACSAPFICADEIPVVSRWLEGLRVSGQPGLRGAQIVIRPHPANAGRWQNADLGRLGPVVIAPGNPTATIEEADRRSYFDTLTHSDAVVGINTSVFLEAGILERPCLAVSDPEITASQTGTLHFRYLADGGLVSHEASAAQHFARLAEALEGSWPKERANEFVTAFLRPHGHDEPALPIAVTAIEDVASIPARPERRPFWSWPLLAVLWPLAALYLRPRYLARRASRPAPGTVVPQASRRSASGRSGA